MLLKDIFSIHTNIVPAGEIRVRCPHCNRPARMAVFRTRRDAAVCGLRVLHRDGRRIIVCPACKGVFARGASGGLHPLEGGRFPR